MKTPSFWPWFLANEKKLRKIHTLPENEGNQLLYWFYQHLRSYNPKIGFQLVIPTNSKGKPTLSFSACDDDEVRQLIYDLIEAAPNIPNWIISTTIITLSKEDWEYFGNEFN